MKKTLVVSISGIRGIVGRGLDPEVLINFTAGYGMWIRQQAEAQGVKPKVVVGRDARVTGAMCARLVMSTLQSLGIDVLDADLATTPTVEMGVIASGAQGGIVLSASHNPAQWNALKLLNGTGEFLSPEEGQAVLDFAEAGDFAWTTYDECGSYTQQDFLDYHIDQILALDFIDAEQIAAKNFTVAVDAVNSVGGLAIPALLKRIGLRDEQIIVLNGEPNGLFAHNPEPLPQNLGEIMQLVEERGADLGIVVDPDVDRLALVENGGRFFSEELTQVLIADFFWRFREGPYTTNLSSSRAIEDVAARYGQEVHRSAVGEINVVKKMQAVGAIAGGEGSGGVIVPDLHHGRDAVVAAAIVLQHLANEDTTLAEIRATMPTYAMAKHKTEIGDLNPDDLLARMAERYADERISTIDGVKIDFTDGWVHMRKSNTEPIIRVYTEAATADEADALAKRFMGELLEG
ncbi:MAG: phosphoglucosamine mutase [Rhodothermales bacterium]